MHDDSRLNGAGCKKRDHEGGQYPGTSGVRDRQRKGRAAHPAASAVSTPWTTPTTRAHATDTTHARLAPPGGPLRGDARRSAVTVTRSFRSGDRLPCHGQCGLRCKALTWLPALQRGVGVALRPASAERCPDGLVLLRQDFALVPEEIKAVDVKVGWIDQDGDPCPESRWVAMEHEVHSSPVRQGHDDGMHVWSHAAHEGSQSVISNADAHLDMLARLDCGSRARAPTAYDRQAVSG